MYVDIYHLKKIDGSKALANLLPPHRNRINVISVLMAGNITDRLSCIARLTHGFMYKSFYSMCRL